MIVVYIFNRKLIKSKLDLNILLNKLDMEERSEIRLWDKLDEIEKDVVEIKITIAKIQSKMAQYAGFFSFVGVIIASIVKEFLFK